MVFVKDDRVYLDLTNDQMKEREEELRIKVDNILHNVKEIKTRIKSLK